MSVLTQPESLVTTSPARDDEAAMVRNWRTLRFMQMGVHELSHARLLADSTVDLHEFDDLRELGWTVEQTIAALL